MLSSFLFFLCVLRVLCGKSCFSPSGLGLSKRLVDVPENVVDVLDADGQPDHVGPDPCLDLFFVRQLTMSSGSGMDHQRLGVADVGKMRAELKRLDELHPGLHAALDAEGHDRSGAL